MDISPKQKACLEYLGIDTNGMTAEQASEAISGAYDNPNLKNGWLSDRLVLHPYLYMDEILKDCESGLRAFVRSKVVGCSERLTDEIIVSVIKDVIEKDKRWIEKSDRNRIFFEELKLQFPGCCDGSPPEVSTKKPRIKSSSIEVNKDNAQESYVGQPVHISRQSGCASVMLIGFGITIFLLSN